jgi:hypothetical protein
VDEYCLWPVRNKTTNRRASFCAAVVAATFDGETFAPSSERESLYRELKPIAEQCLPDAVALFYGATLVAAAWRGQPGCEATVLSNLILG